MTVLHTLFHDELSKAIDGLGVDLIVRKLETQDIHLSQREQQQLGEALEAGDLDRLQIRAWQWWKTKPIHVDISDADIDEVESAANDLIERLPAILGAVVESVTPDILILIRKHYPKDIRRDSRDIRRFETRLLRRWQPAFESLSLIIELSTRCGSEIAPQVLTDEDDQPTLPSVLFRLHARGIQVAKEIVTLLRSGYPDGAMARWRTLHEIAVVASFISSHGEDCATRYVAHTSVEHYKGSRRYQEAAPMLGYAPMSDDEIEKIEAHYNSAVAQYGKNFAQDYGWASAYLGGKRPTFAAIEKAVELDHLRPFYRMAGHHVHANPMGMICQLALREPGPILIGPSNFGLADPGQNTGLTLALLTAVLMQLAPTLDAIVGCRALIALSDEVAQQFVEIQAEIDAEEDTSED